MPTLKMDKHVMLLVPIILCSTMLTVAQDSVTPDQSAGRRSFNAFNIANANGYLSKFPQISDTLPTKQGPVLFPNDAPLPPRPPLVVTARPLVEQIARSELNPLPRTRNQTEDNINLLKLLTGQSPSSGVSSLRVNVQRAPSAYSGALGRSNNLYGDIDLSNSYSKTRNLTEDNASLLHLLSSPSPATGVSVLEPIRINLKHSYADLLRSYPDGELNRDNRYQIYEQSSPFPPLNKALSQRAHQNAVKASVVKQESDNRYQATGDYHGNGLVVGDGAKVELYGGNSDQGADYAFSYAVKDGDTGDDFSHAQRSSGRATRGEYRVRLPDGRRQVVSYTADEGGYQAQVRYDDERGEERKQELKNDVVFKTNYDVSSGSLNEHDRYYDAPKDYPAYGADYSSEYNNFKDDLIAKPKPTFNSNIVPKTHNKLGRIVVPNKDYDYTIDRFNKNAVTTNNYNDIDTILITPTKPSFEKSYNIVSTPSGFDYNNLYTATPKTTAYNSYLSGYLNSKYSNPSSIATPVYEQYTVSPEYYKNTFSPSVASNYLVTKDYLNAYQKTTPQTPSVDYGLYGDYSGDNLSKNIGYPGYGVKNIGKANDNGGRFNKYLG